MKLKSALTFVLASVIALPAMAVEPPGWKVPYGGASMLFSSVDSKRQSDDGFGYLLRAGFPLEGKNAAIEAEFFDHAVERNIDGNDDYVRGILINYVHAFGGDRIIPFVLGGGGLIEDDARGRSDVGFGLDAGGGVLVPFGQSRWSFRADLRALLDSNIAAASGQSGMLDWQLLAGIQMPFSRSGPEPAVDSDDCALGVVGSRRANCDVDSDGDGVLDGNDRCPGTPAGTRVDSTGCQIPTGVDSDADGVVDNADLCPGTPAGTQVDRTGCKLAEAIVLEGVTFLNDSAEIMRDSRAILNRAAAVLRANPRMRVEIAGHTDNIGAPEYNQQLSLKRAEAVAAHMVMQGVDASRMIPRGYGPYEPIADNSTPEGRASNRRVEFRVIYE